MLENSFEKIKARVVLKLKDLDPRLAYHDIAHTLDVLKQVEDIARQEGVTDERIIYLLRVAALYHDTGFLYCYQGHEEEGCRIFREDAKDYDVSENEIQFIEKLIMATLLSNTPHPQYEEMIRDADLDYLGRKDFEEISNRLRQEWLVFEIVGSQKEWESKQLSFLKKHHYYTRSSVDRREAVKQENIRQLANSTE